MCFESFQIRYASLWVFTWCAWVVLCLTNEECWWVCVGSTGVTSVLGGGQDTTETAADHTAAADRRLRPILRTHADKHTPGAAANQGTGPRSHDQTLTNQRAAVISPLGITFHSLLPAITKELNYIIKLDFNKKSEGVIKTYFPNISVNGIDTSRGCFEK